MSIPDGLFARAERLAKSARRSRSELSAAALDEYVARHAPDEVTDTMNRVCDDVGVLLTARMTNLPKDSIANVSQVIALDRGLLEQPAGRIPPAKIGLLLGGIDVVLGR